MSSPVLRAAFGAFVALLRRPHRRSLQVTLDNAVSVRRAQRLYIRLDQCRSNLGSIPGFNVYLYASATAAAEFLQLFVKLAFNE